MQTIMKMNTEQAQVIPSAASGFAWFQEMQSETLRLPLNPWAGRPWLSRILDRWVPGGNHGENRDRSSKPGCRIVDRQRSGSFRLVGSVGLPSCRVFFYDLTREPLQYLIRSHFRFQL